MTQPEQQLQQGLENLYLVFRGYPFRSEMPCCIPHCFSKEEIAALNKPLRELSGAELSKFAWKLLNTCGEAEDFKHFLPRLFELTIKSDSYFCNIEITLGKLGRTNFTSWPTLEYESILSFLRHWWQVVLETPPEYCNITVSEFLTGLCCANTNIQPFLELWLNSSTLIASLHLTDFIEDNGAKLRMGKKFNAFLGPEHLPIINQWLFSNEIQSYLEQAFFTHTEKLAAERISIAVDILASLRKFQV